MKSNGAFTPQGTPNGDSISKMSLFFDNNCGSGIDLDSMDSECVNIIGNNSNINGNANNFNSHNIKYNSKNNKYKMSQHYYFISFVVSILFVFILTPNIYVLADDASGSGYSEVTTEFSEYLIFFYIFLRYVNDTTATW